ncbi:MULTISPECIES: FadR/GntR family transcriptional regulator [Methylobacterium]|uniref:FadR/GntR family transcriptional regulator n=1 Tax=Methylobacterium TaxID=407 RepID=UPI0011CCB817|nr:MULTISPECIES: FadR/GntR family transcriptional regulator [Methylobacterium]TXN71316.1 FadR family transcriptional regulator [Methylobacterium sp. WL18]GJE20345.1 HTH-type transcriptional regulator LutR [Methylobacterium mesophilicum]
MRGDPGYEDIKLPLASGSRRIHGSVARDLGIAILAGRYAPGDVLPGEIEFSEQLKVSRTAYREAIRILSAKGLVESRPRTGTRVTQRSRWNLLDPDILAWAFEAEPSETFIRDLFELRMIVEPAAAALAAERRSALDISRMGHALEEMGRYGLATEIGRAADQAFHNTILEAARNGPLMALSSSIAAAVTWTTIFKQRRSALPRDPMPDHRILYEAIVAGDVEAARVAMTELVRLALSDTELSLTA